MERVDEGWTDESQEQKPTGNIQRIEVRSASVLNILYMYMYMYILVRYTYM